MKSIQQLAKDAAGKIYNPKNPTDADFFVVEKLAFASGIEFMYKAMGHPDLDQLQKAFEEQLQHKP